MSLAKLADEYGELEQQVKTAQARMKVIKSKFLTAKAETFKGSKWTVTKSIYDVTRMNTSLIKEEMGEEWVKEHSITSTTSRFNTTLTAAKKAA